MTTVSDSISTAASKPHAEQAFALLLDRLTTLCTVERDAVDMPVGDLAFDDWLRAAEAARSATVKAAAAVLFTAPSGPAAVRYHAIARNFESMLLAEDPVSYARVARGLRMQHKHLFFVPGPGKASTRATALLRAFRDRFDELLELPDYSITDTPHPSYAMSAMAA